VFNTGNKGCIGFIRAFRCSTIAFSQLGCLASACFLSCDEADRAQRRFLFPAFLLLFTKWASQSFCAICHVASKRNATAQFELHVEWGTCEDRECVRRRYFLSRTML
jgi:hypothetical protein